MSSFDIFQYPVMTPELHEKLGCTQNEPSFTYEDHGEERSLDYESVEGATSLSPVWKVSDKLGKWHPDHSGLDIAFSGEVEIPAFLFGPSGLLPSTDSVFGVGIIWTDKESKVRGSLPVGVITSDCHDSYEYRARVHFDPGELRGILSLRTVLYVEKSSGSEKGCRFASGKGTVLGILDEMRIVIEGSGSIFPISETSKSGEPLWWVETYIEDPNLDPFDEEHFLLTLNKAHKNYPDLHIGERESSYLLKEVIADALFTLITQVQRTEGGDEAIRTASSAQPGSLAKIIHYMASVNGWLNSIDNPEELNRKIHQWADKEVSI